MAVDLKTVTAVAIDYANYVRKVMPVHKVFIYGSYSKGNATELSDVDICFFLNSFLGKERVKIIATLLGLTSKFKNVLLSQMFLKHQICMMIILL
jgi:predicted nucleotidyltransferase